jgi:hypothetical protein
VTVNEEKCVCGAPADDHVFDRSICPEPCGMMHYYCAQCGALSPFETCPHEEEGKGVGARDDLERIWRRVQLGKDVTADDAGRLLAVVKAAQAVFGRAHKAHFVANRHYRRLWQSLDRLGDALAVLEAEKNDPRA